MRSILLVATLTGCAVADDGDPLEDQVAQLRADIVRLQADLREVSTDGRDGLAQRVTQLETENDLLRARVRTLETGASDRGIQIDTLDADLAQLDTEHQATATTLVTVQGDVADLTDRLSTAETALTQQAAAVQATTDLLLAAGTLDLVALTSRVDDAEAGLADLDARFAGWSVDGDDVTLSVDGTLRIEAAAMQTTTSGSTSWTVGDTSAALDPQTGASITSSRVNVRATDRATIEAPLSTVHADALLTLTGGLITLN